MSAQAIGDVRLLVSELLTNSIRHAGLDPDESIRLVASASEGMVRVEVSDPGPGFEVPSVPVPRPEHACGWGLYLLDALADEWGVFVDYAAYVWFEIGSGTRVSHNGVTH